MPQPRTSPSERAPSAQRAGADPDLGHRRGALAKVIPRRPRVAWWLALALAAGFAALATPTITAERWLLSFGPGSVAAHQPAPFTVRAPMLAGYEQLRVRGGVVVARGETVSSDQAAIADSIAEAIPRGPMLYLAFFAITLVLAGVFTYHMRRSVKGRLVRVQVVNLVVIAALAAVVKLLVLSTTLSALVVPVAVLAMVPTMALDRIVGIATGVLAALVVSLQAPFDVGLAILLLVQAATAGLVVAEHPKRRWTAALGAGLVTTLCTGATYFLLTFLTTGSPPELHDPLHSPWIAAAIGPAIAAVIAVPLLPLYQLLVGEITQGRLFALEDLGHPLLRQIAEKAPGTWQHSLMMANMAEIAANAIGASGRLVRVGAYFHDLGKSLSPKHFIENLEPGETSPHDQLPPEVSCDAIFAHVTEGLAAARRAGLHERIVDFMHMHHGNGVLEYFWAKCREQGNPRGFAIEDFRYPGHPPQSRETAILAICDAVEAASRTLKKPDPASIDSLVQRIVYGKLHLGQLDESGLSMGDLRRISDSLRETIRHANHGRIEYPWQKAGQDASASVMTQSSMSTPRLDSLDRRPVRESNPRAPAPPPIDAEAALVSTANVGASAPAEYAALTGEPGDARIRAGTARNALAGGPPAGDSGDAGRVREVRAEDIRAAEAAHGYAETSYAELNALPPERRAPTGAIPPGRVTDRGTGAVREPGPGPLHGTAAPTADHTAPARDRTDPTRDPRATAPDGTVSPRDPAAIAARAAPEDAGAGLEVITERDGVAPLRDPGAGPALARDPGPAPSAAPTLARDPASAPGPAPALARDPGSAPTLARDPGSAPGSGPALARDPASAPAPARDPASALAPAHELRSTLRDGAPALRDPDPFAPTIAPFSGTAHPGGLVTTPGRAAGPRAPTAEPATEPARAAAVPPQPATAPRRHDPTPAPRRHDPTPAPRRHDPAPAPRRHDPTPAPRLHDPARAMRRDDPAPATRRDDPPSGPRRHDPTPAPAAGAPNPQRLVTIPGRAAGPQSVATGSGFVPNPQGLATTLGRAPAPQATAPDPSIATAPRGAPGEPPTASADPTQLAAALANLASRVRAAPFGPSSAVEPVPRPGADDLDRTLTSPPPPVQLAPRTPPRGSGLSRAGSVHEATTRPVLASSRAPSAHDGSTEPVLTSAVRPAAIPAQPVEPVTVKRRASTESGPDQLRPPARPAEAPRARPAAHAIARPVARPGTHPTLHDGARVIIPPRVEPGAAPSDLDAGATDPSMPALIHDDDHRAEPARRAAPRGSIAPGDITERKDPWAAGLAARVDAALDSDEWNHETPIVPPTKAELRALLGRPDPTRQQPLDELERLQRHAAELGEAEPPRRSPHPTAEVDPDDIVAAIELAPPARRPTHAGAVGVAKPRKPE